MDAEVRRGECASDSFADLGVMLARFFGRIHRDKLLQTANQLIGAANFSVKGAKILFVCSKTSSAVREWSLILPFALIADTCPCNLASSLARSESIWV